jgi:hypothetical protein
MLLRLLFAAVMISTVARAQGVHVRVSPDVKTGIESTTEYHTIQMALDHHPFAGVDPDGKPSRVFIEIAPAPITSMPSSKTPALAGVPKNVHPGPTNSHPPKQSSISRENFSPAQTIGIP